MRSLNKVSRLLIPIMIGVVTFIMTMYGLVEKNLVLVICCMLALFALISVHIRAVFVRNPLEREIFDYSNYLRDMVVCGNDPVRTVKTDEYIDEWCALNGKSKQALSRLDTLELYSWLQGKQGGLFDETNPT